MLVHGKVIDKSTNRRKQILSLFHVFYKIFLGKIGKIDMGKDHFHFTNMVLKTIASGALKLNESRVFSAILYISKGNTKPAGRIEIQRVTQLDNGKLSRALKGLLDSGYLKKLNAKSDKVWQKSHHKQKFYLISIFNGAESAPIKSLDTDSYKCGNNTNKPSLLVQKTHQLMGAESAPVKSFNDAQPQVESTTDNREHNYINNLSSESPRIASYLSNELSDPKTRERVGKCILNLFKSYTTIEIETAFDIVAPKVKYPSKIGQFIANNLGDINYKREIDTKIKEEKGEKYKQLRIKLNKLQNPLYEFLRPDFDQRVGLRDQRALNELFELLNFDIDIARNEYESGMQEVAFLNQLHNLIDRLEQIETKR